jgi:hypothetical protein
VEVTRLRRDRTNSKKGLTVVVEEGSRNDRKLLDKSRPDAAAVSH